MFFSQVPREWNTKLEVAHLFYMSVKLGSFPRYKNMWKVGEVQQDATIQHKNMYLKVLQA
jgi:hypothetical protein